MAFLFALDEMATEQGDETGSVFTWEWWFGAEKVMATCSEIDCRCWSCECPDGYTVMPGFLPPETRGNCPNGGFYSEAEPEIECIAEEAMKNFG